MSPHTDHADPPKYDALPLTDLPDYQARTGLSHEHPDVPPAYTTRRTRRHRVPRESRSTYRTGHVFELCTAKNRAWATLKLQSSARDSQQLPVYMEGRPIVGSLDLDLSKEDPIHSVSITVTGRIVTGASTSDMFTFLSYTHPIWSKADVFSTSGGREPRLNGQNSWPFSFVLPDKVTLAHPNGHSQFYRLPQTFTEDYVRATVFYDLAVTILRGKLRADSSIQTPIAYIPLTRPSAPSLLRQLAYQANLPIPPPESDPEGWHVLPTTPMSGMNVQLAIATPGSFTRGTVIPLFLVLTPTHWHASTAPPQLQPPIVRLVRRLGFMLQGQPMEITDVVKRAVWWPANDVAEADSDEWSPVAPPAGTRRMHGEIVLKKDLKPTMALAHFSVEYSIALYPTQTVASTTATTMTTMSTTTMGTTNSNRMKLPPAVVRQPVEIVTQHGRGPRVRAYAPPTYDSNEAHSAEDDDEGARGDVRDKQKWVYGLGKGA